MLDSQISAGFWQKFLASDWSRCRCWWENPWWVYLHRRLAQKIWLFVEGDSAGFFSQGLWRSNCIKFSSLGRRFVHFFLSSTGQIRCYLREVQGNIFGIYHGVIFQSLHTWTIGFPNFLIFFGDFQSFSSHLSVSQNQVMRYTLSGCHWMGKNGTTLFRVFPSFFQKPIYESPFIAHWISVFSCFKPSIYH